jgi:hypothetical protein
MHVLSATSCDAHGMIVARLGHRYRGKGHPGELREKLFAGMAHM